MLLRAVLLGVGSGWFGMATAALSRSLPVAVAVFFVVATVIEPLAGLGLAALHTGADGWLPLHAIGQVTACDQVIGWPSAPIGGALFLLVMVSLVGLAGFVLARRDA